MRAAVLFLLGLLVCTSAAAEELGWRLRKDSEGIKVYTRKVEGSPVLEFRAETTLDVSRDKVVAFYEQIERYKEWFSDCTGARLLETKSPNEALIYFTMDMPWPVADRDSAYRRVKTEEGGDIVFRLSEAPDAYPRQPDFVRIPYLKVEWHFRELPDGRTWVSFQQHCDTGGHIPAAIVNRLCVNIPFKTFGNLRALLAEKN